MTGTLLARGMLVGLVAGLMGFVVATVLGEGPLSQAIHYESTTAALTAGAHHGESAAHAMSDDHGAEVFSRLTQSTVGLMFGLVFFAIALGGILGLVFAAVQGRLGGLSIRATSLLLSLGGFMGFNLLPGLKYPANPPAANNPDTINSRTALYFAMIAICVLVVVGSSVLARQLRGRFGGWNGGLIAIAAGAGVLAVTCAVMPGVHETPPDFPAEVLWNFRIASIAVQATTWATLGVLFGAVTQRRVLVQRDSSPTGLSLSRI